MAEEQEEEQAETPWWQRELNAWLARRALRREALKRLAVRAVSAVALTALGVGPVLALAQDTQGRLVQRTRRPHSGQPPMSTAGAPTRVSTGFATASTRQRRSGGTTLTLNPLATGSASAKRASTLRVTATDRGGAPLRGITIWLTIAGPVPYSGAATTDALGVASFAYRAGDGPYVVHITATAAGSQLAQSTVQVGAEPVVATTSVTGRFYASDDRCTYDTPANTSPLFLERLSTINFAGRPFTEYGAGPDPRPAIAASGEAVVGVGSLNHFNAVFTGSLVVRQAGDVPFTFLIDDAFDLGVGGGASRVSGTMSNPPPSGTTSLEHLPIVGAFNQGNLEATTHVTVRFPRAGAYPYEVDYSECRGGNTALRVTAAGQFLPLAETQSR